MTRTPWFERSVVALVVSACSVACGGSAVETGAGTGGASSAGTESGGTSSGGASHGGTSSGGSSQGGTSSGGTSSGGTSSGGSASGGTSSGVSCDQAKAGYGALLANLLAKNETTVCVVDSDCTYVGTAECGNSCSTSLVSLAGSASFSSELGDYTTANCTNCRFPVMPCPLSLLPAPTCVAGKCQKYSVTPGPPK